MKAKKGSPLYCYIWRCRLACGRPHGEQGMVTLRIFGLAGISERMAAAYPERRCIKQELGYVWTQDLYWHPRHCLPFLWWCPDLFSQAFIRAELQRPHSDTDDITHSPPWNLTAFLFSCSRHQACKTAVKNLGCIACYVINNQII